MSIAGIGAGPVTPVTNQTSAAPVTKVPVTPPVQVAAASGNGQQSPQNAGPAQSSPPGSNQPLNTRGRGQIVNLLV